jgi:hypothetical protein
MDGEDFDMAISLDCSQPRARWEWCHCIYIYSMIMRALRLRIGVPELEDCGFTGNLVGGEKDALSAVRR